MPARDADATRQRLLDAGRAEFAEYGIAGARVDRIAANAQSNKAQIYHYFQSKDGLFDAVWEAMVQQVVEEAPLDVTDLPGYAARLSDGYAQHPDIVRLVTWQRLERGSDPPHAYATRSTQAKIDAIARAQAEGVVPDQFDAPVLLALILQVAALWAMSSPDVLAVVKVSSTRKRREAVRQAVAAFLARTP
jgi:AcrR family transcriptional regulator